MDVEEVILVDEHDVPVGQMEKLAAHRLGKLHRAFSVFIFNSRGELLLQRRALGKYHSGGLWTNTCCGHPRPGEETKAAAGRRLQEESNIEAELFPLFSFPYRTVFANDLIEHEIDHVFKGSSDQPPTPNPSEAEEWKYMGLKDLSEEVNSHPERFTAWLRICLERVVLIAPVIDRNRCEGSGACVRVCPFKVFEIRKLGPRQRSTLSVRGKLKAWAHGGRQAYLANPKDCHACRLCIDACPEHALEFRKTGDPAPVA